MKVKEVTTGYILESENDFVVGQWIRHADRYIPISDADINDRETKPKRGRPSKELDAE